MSSDKTGFSSLKDLGISRDEASRWKAYAAMDDDEWEAFKEEIVAQRGALEVTELSRRLREKRLADRRAAAPPSASVVLPPDVRIEWADARQLPLDDASVDLVVTSPPYGLDVAYHAGDVEADAWPPFMAAWLGEALRVTKPSGRLALNVPLDASEPTYRPTYAQAVVAALLAGWQYRSTIVWAEGNTTKGGWALGSQASAARPHHVSQVEMIALFSRGEWAPSSSNPDDITPDEFLLAGRGPWTFSGESRPWERHPAAFPLELPRRLIPYLSRVGDVVLDPFCGSGTTLVAAVERHRQAIGFDISPAYVESAQRRVAGG